MPLNKEAKPSQTNYSVCGYIILYKNKHIIVHLTEVFVSYIPKFDVFHTALDHSRNFCMDNFNVCLSLSLVVKRGLDMSLKSGANILIVWEVPVV